MLGYYDETSPEVIDWQIKWLVENGFSFLLVDWYWNRGSRSHEHWVRAFDRARYNKYLKWAVMWANHTPPGSHSVEDQRAVTRYWIDNYFNKPYYYRIDGRPVVVIWQPGNMRRDLGPHGTHKLLHISQEMAKEAGLPGICFIAMKWPEAAVDAQAIETLKADGFSMTSIYHYMGTGDRTPANPARYDFSLVAESSPEFWNRNHKSRASCPSCRIFPPDGTIFPGTSTAAPRSRTGRRSCSGRSAATPGASRTGPAPGVSCSPRSMNGEKAPTPNRIGSTSSKCTKRSATPLRLLLPAAGRSTTVPRQSVWARTRSIPPLPDGWHRGERRKTERFLPFRMYFI